MASIGPHAFKNGSMSVQMKTDIALMVQVISGRSTYDINIIGGEIISAFKTRKRRGGKKAPDGTRLSQKTTFAFYLAVKEAGVFELPDDTKIQHPAPPYGPAI